MREMMMEHNIYHDSLIPIDKVKFVEDFYSKKDEVDVKYVMTSALPNSINSLRRYDIYFRETPHPVFKNRYFGLAWQNKQLYIVNADSIDDIVIGMIYDDETDTYHYSSHRHDYKSFKNRVIDGGREYIRGFAYKLFILKDGKFKERIE